MIGSQSHHGPGIKIHAEHAFETHPVAVDIAGADKDQEPPDLLLKNDDQGDDANPDHLPEDRTEQFHLEHLDDAPEKINRQDADDDVDGNGPPHEHVKLVHQQGNQEDVQDVENADMDEKRDHSLSVRQI